MNLRIVEPFDRTIFLNWWICNHVCLRMSSWMAHFVEVVIKSIMPACLSSQMRGVWRVHMLRGVDGPSLQRGGNGEVNVRLWAVPGWLRSNVRHVSRLLRERQVCDDKLIFACVTWIDFDVLSSAENNTTRSKVYNTSRYKGHVLEPLDKTIFLDWRICNHVCLRRCGESGECICYAGWTGPDCSVEATDKPTCGCGQFQDGCEATCNMFLDCSGNGRWAGSTTWQFLSVLWSIHVCLFKKTSASVLSLLRMVRWIYIKQYEKQLQETKNKNV